MNWINEGKEAAERYIFECMDDEEDVQSLTPSEPECPWPIYTPEGADWLKGWNSLVDEQQGTAAEEYIVRRPQGAGWMFEPEAA